MSDAAGDNSKAEREIWLKHQAIAIVDEENRSAQSAVIGRHRKQAKADGVELADLDWTIKVIRWPVGDIVDFFKRRLKALTFNNINVIAKVDEIFGGQTEDQRYAGVLAGMQGKLAAPPANLTPNERQTWLEGWHEGNKNRDAALFDLEEERKRGEAAAKAAAESGATAVADASTSVAQELGDPDYGDEQKTEGEEGAGGEEKEPPAAAAPAASPHQPARKSRAKKSAAAG